MVTSYPHNPIDDGQLQHLDVTVNGVRLHVVQAGPPDGHPVILLHGFPEFWYGWHRQIGPLARSGFRVIVPDQRGYSLSDKPDGVAAYRVDALVSDVLGLIAWTGAPQVSLAGHDWGAIVAWWTALRHPSQLDKLIIANVPHPHVLRDTLRTNPRQFLKSWYAGFFQLPGLPEALLAADDYRGLATSMLSSANPGTFSEADIAAYRAAWGRPGALSAMLNWYRAYVRHAPAFPTNLRVSVPTLMLWGMNDIALIPDMAEASIRLCREGELYLFRDATHWVQHDKADRVTDLMRQFLSMAG